MIWVMLQADLQDFHLIAIRWKDLRFPHPGTDILGIGLDVRLKNDLGFRPPAGFDQLDCIRQGIIYCAAHLYDIPPERLDGA
jgi:hypothetical protein